MPDAVIVDAIRTPVGRAFKGSMASLRPDETLAFVVDQLLERNPGVDPRSLIPVGHRATREHLEAFIDAGMSKFVLRPPLDDGTAATEWLDELGELAVAVIDLQT